MTKKWEPLLTIAKSVNTGQQTATELVNKSLKAIKDTQEFNTAITVCADYALAKAKIIDDLVKSGKSAGRLAGIPYMAKDNYLTKGIETTAGSNILKGYIPPYSATVVDRLEAEGAILVGKTNLDAFAHGSSTENSDFGPTLNPHNKTRVPGGSSGGSAAAVALGQVPFAIGTDTGGSIRLPASFCGVVGLKPTYGLVPRYGVVAMASSTDVMGPLTNSVADSALLLDIMAGADSHDATVIDREPNYGTLSTNLEGVKVGVIKEFFGEGLDESVDKSIRAALGKLESAGVELIEVSVPSVKLALSVYYIVMPAEVSSNLSRFDGVRYGPTVREGTINELYIDSRTKGFNAENKRRIMVGTYVLSSGYYDAYYKKAQTVRTKLIDEFSEVFNTVDILAGPTAPMTAFKLGENTEDPLKMYLSDVLTVSSNLVGNPAISIPVTSVNELPVGLQLMAAQRNDRQLLGFAAGAEGAISD